VRVAKVINKDPGVGKYLKVVFMPNFNVTMAEKIIPAIDLAEQISTAGSEASGTSNIKFIMNGAVLLGTHDGINEEIRKAVGDENIFLFGVKEHEVEAIREQHKGHEGAKVGLRLIRAIDTVRAGAFGSEWLPPVEEMLLTIESGKDHFLIAHEFDEYLATEALVDKAFQNQTKWTRKSILNCLLSGSFSSDNAVKQYCEEIWRVKSQPVPKPTSEVTRRKSFSHLVVEDEEELSNPTKDT